MAEQPNTGKADPRRASPSRAQVTAAVDAFRGGQLDECLRVADDIDDQFGPSKLTALYRERCQFFRDDPTAAFDCTITLAEK